MLMILSILFHHFYHLRLNVGTGKFIGADGHVYVGDWVEDKMQGTGRFTWNNGDVYEGSFKANQMDGQGKITHKNGNVWQGQFKHDRKEGRGQALKAANAGVHKGYVKQRAKKNTRTELIKCDLIDG